MSRSYGENSKSDYEYLIRSMSACGLGSGTLSKAGRLYEDVKKLQAENRELRALVYKCRGLLHTRTSVEAYEIWEEVVEKLNDLSGN